MAGRSAQQKSDNSPDPRTQVTGLLTRIGDGDAVAADELVPVLQAELRAIAAKLLRAERAGHTLQPTALVNEAYLRLVNQSAANYRSRGHFLAIAAMVMRRILVNHAQRRAAAKRGGGAKRLPLGDDLATSDAPHIDLIALDDALNRLAARAPRKAQVVEQKFFGGIEMSQIADNLGVSLATVKRDWEYARTWLMRDIQQGD